jgi:hypothetical protein
MSSSPVNIYEYEALARERLPQAEYDFIAGGATDEITLRRTRAVFDAIILRSRGATNSLLVTLWERSGWEGLCTRLQGPCT